tara:strand:+ start:5608 stop:10308 length:4701 start_codon:yes stop_codon:yes gene_type:complete
MRKTTTATVIITLLLFSLSSPFLVSASDSTISSDITWSGQHILSGNVTVSQGATLTIEPGSSIDCGDDFWIQIEGTIISENAHFFSSTPPVTQGSHGAGLWKGLVIESSGIGFFNNTLIENAKTGILVNGELNANNLQITHSYIGVNNAANSNINGYYSFQIDYQSIQNDGDLVLSNSIIEHSATGIQTSGISSISDSNFSNVGVALKNLAGETIAQDLDLEMVTVGIASQTSAKVRISNVLGQDIALLIDAANSDDLHIDNVDISGDRILVSNSASSFRISNVSFTGNLAINAPSIDQQCIGVCILDNITISNVNSGISLSGPGTHMINQQTVSSTDIAIEASGSGHILAHNLSIQTDNAGLIFRGPSSLLTGDNSIVVTQSQSLAIDILDSTHIWSNVVIDKPFNQQDTHSTAFNSWYAELEFNHLIINNFSTGVYLQDSHFSGVLLEVHGGTDTAIEMLDSHLVTNSISTKYQAFGAQLRQQSYLQTSNWVAELHNSPIEFFDNSQANIRVFEPLNTNSNSYDASGEGTIFYGGSTSVTLSTTNSGYFEETNVQFTDISSNPIQATIKVNGFEISCDVNGLATLPLFSQGSTVEAIFSGTGVTQTLNGGQPSQVVQIPLIPQGDWTITSGQSVILGPRPDGQPHFISGHLVMQGDSSLKLASSELIVDPNFEISLLSSSQIVGVDAKITTSKINIQSSGLVTSILNSQLMVEGMVNWSCTTTKSIVSVIFNQTLQIHPNCNIEMLGGDVSSSVIVSNQASFTQLASLELSVIDKGSPVENALISINGTNVLTDQYGQVLTNATARYIDQTTDNLGGLQNITLQIDSFTDFISWDSSKSFIHTFMASTVDSGILPESIILEAKWSPYYLQNNLLIPQLKSLKIDDGVSFRISDGVSITVDGTLDAGDSTIASTGLGARWAGLVLGDQLSSRIELSNTDVIEASTPIHVSQTGTIYADGVSLMRSTASEPLLYVESGSNAIIEIKNSILSDGGSACIELYQSQAQILLSNLEFSNCNGPAIWARQTEIQASNITIGEGIETGFYLTEVSGSISFVDATQFTGSGNVFWLDSMDEQFILNSVIATTGGSAAIAGRNNRNLAIDSLEITGAPAIDFDNSAGLLSNIELFGPGSGNGLINHHGRSSSSMIVENLNLNDYSVGLDLHSDNGDFSAPFIVRDSTITAATSISAENYSAVIESTTLSGQSELSDQTTINFIDSIFQTQPSISLWNGAQAYQYHTIILDAQLSGTPQMANFDIITTNSDGTTSTKTVSGTAILYQLLVKQQPDQSDMIELTNLQIIAKAAGLPSKSVSFDNPNQWTINTFINIPLQSNQPPSVVITEPSFGQKVMQQQIFQSNATVSDDLDLVSELIYEWTIFNAQNNQIFQVKTDSPTYNFTVPSPGIYVLELEVSDLLGASTVVTMSFESIPLDSDGDNTVDCDQDTWFDLKIGRSCGPDIYDSDDDNDGFDDQRDAWPLDACAWQDTDDDKQPDELNCPSGLTTTLIEDQDDDGDGTPDVLEGESNDNSGDFDTLTMLILVVLAIVFVLFIMRMRKGDGQDGEDKQYFE